MRPNIFSTRAPKNTLSGLYLRLYRGSTILTLLMMVLLFGSCKKEIQLLPESDPGTTYDNPHEKYLRTTTLNGKILPRGTMLSVSHALEYLNDGMNYIYCRPDTTFLETVVFKDSFDIPIDLSDEIDEDDLIILMDDIAEFAGEKYYADMRTEKEPLLFDMNRISSPNPAYARIEATFGMEAGSPINTTDEYEYEDSWIYGQWGQDVSQECSEEEVNADAADLLRRDLRKHVTYRNKFEAYYFKNPYVVCFSGHDDQCFSNEIPQVYFPTDEDFNGSELINQHDITSNDNLYERLLFYNYSGNTGYHTCLSDDEMNFHFEAMQELAQGLLPSPAENNVIAQIEVGYNLIASGTSTIFHTMLVVKATKAVIEHQEDIEPTLLPAP